LPVRSTIISIFGATFLSIEQIASPIGRHRNQRLTLIGLGLNRIGRVVEHADTPEIRGMIIRI
jgi:large subunit ribosomal protein L30